jgi:hypothetical protein
VFKAGRQEQSAHAARANAAVIDTLEQELQTERSARIQAELVVLELHMERAKAQPNVRVCVAGPRSRMFLLPICRPLSTLLAESITDACCFRLKFVPPM